MLHSYIEKFIVFSKSSIKLSIYKQGVSKKFFPFLLSQKKKPKGESGQKVNIYILQRVFFLACTLFLITQFSQFSTDYQFQTGKLNLTFGATRSFFPNGNRLKTLVFTWINVNVDILVNVIFSPTPAPQSTSHLQLRISEFFHLET